MRRAHYQAAIWRLCEAQDPPQESPEDFGWYKDDINGIMLPKFHDTSPVLAPEELLKLIRCQCKAMEGRCTHKKCSCREANVPCTKFCGCYLDGKNCERQVQHQTAADSEDSDQDPDATADQFTDILSSSDDE